MTGSKTPHEGSLCAAEKAYVQYFEYRAMDYAVREYLRTLLSDERVKEEISDAIMEDIPSSPIEYKRLNPDDVTGYKWAKSIADACTDRAISTLKRIAEVE